ICQRIVAEAKAGKTVARLKGGDPSVFGRLAEEVDALQSAGVPFEIVPGVTTATAAGAYAGVTITDRDRASSVALVAGHLQADKADGDDAPPDFAALASFPGTIVIYMGVTTAASWSGELIANGKPAETPVVLVRRCTLPDQTIARCTLGEVPDVLAPGRIRPPLVAIVGEVAVDARASSWFTERPLFGKTVLVTRPKHQAARLIARLEDLGASVVEQPAIEIGPPDDWEPVDAAIDRLADFDWVVFSSSNGVERWLDRMASRGLDARAFASAKIAAIGPATREALNRYRLNTDLQPNEFRAEALADALVADAGGKRFLLVRASRGREVLGDRLQAAGGKVEHVVAYRSTDVLEANDDVARKLSAGEIDWATVTSSAIAKSLVNLFGEGLRNARLAAISPLTAGVLSDAGFEPAAVAEQYTTDGLIDAMLAASEE
ncbi:MAG: uroporphyrinogen-III synthase, partial [Planctomycetota bacterium]